MRALSRMSSIGAAFVVLSMGALLQGCPGDPRGLEMGRLVLDEHTRTYYYRVPSDYDGITPLPVVLVLHGFGGSGPIAAGSTHFAELVDTERFVAVFPDGLNRRWRYGGAINEGDPVDDVAFLKAVVTHLDERVVVDHKRVYATGFSNGAFMALALGCVASDTFAAVAPVAGGVESGKGLDCDGARAVPTLFFHGTDDPFVPYGGGAVSMGPTREVSLLSAPQAAELVAERNGCTGTPTDTALLDIDPNDHTRVFEATYACNPDAEVVFYRIEGGGHTWPGGDGILGRRFVGRTSHDIDASRVIWAFFKRHSLP